MDIPKNKPLSRDIIDRRNRQKPSLKEKARDVAIAVRNDWNDMKDTENQKKGIVPKMSPLGIPSYKRGGTVKKTGIVLLHKGEKVIPKNKAKKVSKLLRKTGKEKYAKR